MATTQSQNRWRSRNRYSKKQLNVMARLETHTALDDIAHVHGLRGKAEAVTFACFVLRWLMQRADHSPQTAEMLAALRDSYHADREIYAP